MATEHIGTRLEILRRAFGLTQRDLSHGTGVTRSLISRIENGRRHCNTVSLAEKFYTFFNIPLEYLLRPIGQNFGEEVFQDSRELSPPQREYVLRVLSLLSTERPKGLALLQNFLHASPAPRRRPAVTGPLQQRTDARKEARNLLTCAQRNGGVGKMRAMIGSSTPERARILREFDSLCQKRRIRVDRAERCPEIDSEPRSICRSQLGAACVAHR